MKAGRKLLEGRAAPGKRTVGGKDVGCTEILKKTPA
jgi:hypothetical protein